MKVGIVGLPNVGKSTLFNCLSQNKAQSENYPFCTIDPNVSIVNVPDKRLDTLNKLISPEKLIPTTVKIVDIAGLVKGARVSVKGMNRTSKWKDEQGVDVYKRFISVEYSDGGKIEINSANAMENQTVENAVEDVPF